MAKLGLASRCCSNAASSKSAPLKELKFSVRPRSIRMRRNCRLDEVDDEAELRLAREIQSGDGLALHLGKGLAACEHVRDQIAAAKVCISEVANSGRRIEAAPVPHAGQNGWAAQRDDETSELGVDARLATGRARASPPD